MKKQRGLRRYYKKLSDLSFIDNLDFSGGDNSWFDLYHIHIDYIGLGNKSWKSRKQHLDSLFLIAEKIEAKLSSYPKDFQYWIELSESDSCEDSIYIHTENPNGAEFPLSIGFDNKLESKNKNLSDYLSHKEYIINTKLLLDYDEKEDLNYFLTKNGFGLKVE